MIEPLLTALVVPSELDMGVVSCFLIFSLCGWEKRRVFLDRERKNRSKIGFKNFILNMLRVES